MLVTVMLQYKQSLSMLLPEKQKRYNGRPTHKVLLQVLCYGVCRWYHQLDWMAQQLLNRPLKSSAQSVYHLILVGLYQLQFTRMPHHAVLNQTVEAARSLKRHWACGLINSVLRRFSSSPLVRPSALENRSAYYAHPAWLIDRFRQDWPNDWSDILEANNELPPFSLRVNPYTAHRRQLFQLPHQTIQWYPESLQLKDAMPCDVLPGFLDGSVSVQDLAAQSAAHLLAVKPHQRVLDACAAPGGKTGHLLELEPTLDLTALDRYSNRLDKIKENLNRLKLQAKLICADASKLNDWWDGQPFDRILLDAPCSATGVIRRHPDIKLLRTPEDIDTVSQVQCKLLHALWPCLKPGGLLLYATCSLLSQENDHMIQLFIHAVPDARVEPLQALPDGVQTPFGWQFLPRVSNGPDGFYYARLKKCA